MALSLCGFAAEPGPNALLVNRADELDCIVDTRDPRRSGAWIWYFSNDMETGTQDRRIGISGVDFRIEDGFLYRHDGVSESGWQKMAHLESQEKGDWLIYHFPKRHLFHPEGKLVWRVAFFPVNSSMPLLFPEGRAGGIRLDRFIDLPRTGEDSVDTELFYDAPSDGPLGNLFAYKSGGPLKPSGLWTKPQIRDFLSPRQYAEPLPHSLWWPQIDAPPGEFLPRDAALGRRAPPGEAIVFDTVGKLSGELKALLLPARVLAAHHCGRAAFFSARDVSDIPTGADGAILPWRFSDGEKGIEESLKTLRREFSGALWVRWDTDYFALKDADRAALRLIWIRHRVLPLLTNELLAEELPRESLVEFIWQILHLRTFLENPQLMEKRLPAPSVAIFPKALDGKRLYHSSSFFQQLFNFLENHFDSLLSRSRGP
ncbi:MAG: hypothetical protein HQL31_01560 [Planctomycetes bacterium]|nr:hypothetical protein [Planctomycetota bacterium]